MGVVLAQAAAGPSADAIASAVAGGAVLSVILLVVFGLLLVVLGVLVPWFVWRTKVYTKRSYLLMRDWARWEQQRHRAGGPGG
jgi:hypothetical protein